MRTRRLMDILVVALFGAGIGLPLVQQATDLLPAVEVVDNRPLAPFPPPDPSAVAAFPSRFEAWYADHMGLRGRLVAGYRWLTDGLLRSPDKIYIGRGDWLYLRKGVREDIETVPLVRDWCGRFRFTQSQLDAWVDAIAGNRRWLAERGIDYLFVVPPNKMTVIPEYLPARIRCRRGVTRLEQLARALKERGGVEVVDLRPALERAADAGVPIWHRTDTHWNARGIAEAYEALVARILRLRPAAGRIERFDTARGGHQLGDLGRMLGARRPAPDVTWSVRPVEPRSAPVENPFPGQADAYGRRSSARVIDDPALPKAMVLHDSYFDGAMNTFLAESFARTVFVFHGRPEIDRELVARENPDMVIQEMVERNLLHPFYTEDAE